MQIRDEIQNAHEEMMAWRHELHEHPQTAFEEEFAHNFIIKKLKEFGVSYKTGYGKYGIVATIKGATNESGKQIGFRCDMDALDIHEESGKTWRSQNEGKMHGCGHDGHMTMMLGAARHLQQNPDFDGTVHLIFQPAEETLEGAKAMIEDGLFDDYPCDEIYGMHNWPWLARGKFATCEGTLMAAVSNIEVTIIGKAGHSGMIDHAIDPVVIAAEIITSMQTLISQRTNPLHPATIYFPILETGVLDTGIVPETAVLKGIIRTLNIGLRSNLEQRARDLCNNIAAGHGATASVKIYNDSDAVDNHHIPTDMAYQVATSIVSEHHVDRNYTPCMSGEDFGFFSCKAPSNFIFIGQREPDDPKEACSYSLHSPYYDFNDNIIPIGVEYWVRLAEQAMPKKAA
ncbi:MAG: amidohydrolase [Micavibrio sp.]|nr:amidohydrolase [Micavibrio sp.]|tara:strand:+ start:1014 stop:2213 length:1200 start_codon:yes stop_codon:yes gene_type:complete